MNAFEIVLKGLDVAHDLEFREAMRPELQRRLLEFTDSEWKALGSEWQKRSPEWQFNLMDTLSPTRHGTTATKLLLELLLNGPTSLIVTAAEKLVASQALEESARSQIVNRLNETMPAGPHESAYRQQLLEQILRPELGPAVAEASEFSIRNREGLSQSSLAACYYCQSVFPVSDISEFTDGDETGLCPRCGIDAVLPSNAGYSFSEASLRALNEFWFG
jgi:hypothetical protein